VVADEAFAQHVAQLRAADLVDYAGVAALKLPMLRELYDTFRAAHLSPESDRGRAFREFVALAGEPLAIHALFDSLCAHFGGGGWRSWPQAFHDPQSPAVRDFARDHADEIELYQYLQWLADTQPEAAQASERASGMLVGIYRDPVGVDADGADAWAAQAPHCTQASVGAPSDALALQGQDWGPPRSIPALRARLCRLRSAAARQHAPLRRCASITHVAAAPVVELKGALAARAPRSLSLR
jgi:(1->4)-alpha-D-glucan 1-alpha-D-glucosylmutase